MFCDYYPMVSNFTNHFFNIPVTQFSTVCYLQHIIYLQYIYYNDQNIPCKSHNTLFQYSINLQQTNFVSWFCEPLLWMHKKMSKLTQHSSFKSEENTNTLNIHMNNLSLSNNCNVWVRSEIQLVWNTLDNSLKSEFCEPLRKRKLACLGRFEKLGLKPSIIVYVSLNSV